jgi:hypothetical protein
MKFKVLMTVVAFIVLVLGTETLYAASGDRFMGGNTEGGGSPSKGRVEVINSVGNREEAIENSGQERAGSDKMVVDGDPEAGKNGEKSKKNGN